MVRERLDPLAAARARHNRGNEFRNSLEWKLDECREKLEREFAQYYARTKNVGSTGWERDISTDRYIMRVYVDHLTVVANRCSPGSLARILRESFETAARESALEGIQLMFPRRFK